MKILTRKPSDLTLSRRKSMDWFLYDNVLCHERAKYVWPFNGHQTLKGLTTGVERSHVRQKYLQKAKVSWKKSSFCSQFRSKDKPQKKRFYLLMKLINPKLKYDALTRFCTICTILKTWKTPMEERFSIKSLQFY